MAAIGIPRAKTGKKSDFDIHPEGERSVKAFGRDNGLTEMLAGTSTLTFSGTYKEETQQSVLTRTVD
jgi:hypothetical protein